MPSGTYGLIYECIWDSSISQDWQGLIVFVALLSMADGQDNVFTDADRLARKTGIPIEIVRHGLNFLLTPDPFSKSRVAEGRRITFIPKLDESDSTIENCRGFHVTNREAYRKLLRKRYNTRYVREHRRLTKSGNPTEYESSAMARSEAAKDAVEEYRRGSK